MRRIIFILITSMTLLSFVSIVTDIDPRLKANPQIAAKSQDHLVNNPAEYLFMVYELDNAYFIREMSTLNEPQKKSLKTIDGIQDLDGNPFKPEVLNDLSSFNFHVYNFERSQTNTIGYDLNNGKVLGFYSIEKLREMYSQSTTSVK